MINLEEVQARHLVCGKFVGNSNLTALPTIIVRRVTIGLISVEEIKVSHHGLRDLLLQVIFCGHNRGKLESHHTTGSTGTIYVCFIKDNKLNLNQTKLQELAALQTRWRTTHGSQGREL